MNPAMPAGAAANARPLLEVPTEARGEIGTLFTLALLKSSSSCCDACRLLRQIVDRMEAGLLQARPSPEGLAPDPATYTHPRG